MIYHIVCFDSDFNIGIVKNDLFTMPWNIPEELEYFKNITKGNVVIMGRNTYSSIGNRPLVDRVNIVVSSSLVDDRVIVVGSVEEALSKAKEYDKDIFIIGGAQLYRSTFDYIDGVYATILDVSYTHKPIYSRNRRVIDYPYEFIKYDAERISDWKLVDKVPIKTYQSYKVTGTLWRRP